MRVELWGEEREPNRKDWMCSDSLYIVGGRIPPQTCKVPMGCRCQDVEVHFWWFGHLAVNLNFFLWLCCMTNPAQKPGLVTLVHAFVIWIGADEIRVEHCDLKCPEISRQLNLTGLSCSCRSCLITGSQFEKQKRSLTFEVLRGLPSKLIFRTGSLRADEIGPA